MFNNIRTRLRSVMAETMNQIPTKEGPANHTVNIKSKNQVEIAPCKKKKKLLYNSKKKKTERKKERKKTESLVHMMKHEKT